MVIYSVTVSIDEEAKQPWLEYMQQHHIPDVMASGCFTGFRFTRVIGTSEERENSFNIQYFANSMKDMHRYQAHYAQALQKEHAERFGSKAVGFRTILEDVV
jgi:hypothetical protein